MIVCVLCLKEYDTSSPDAVRAHFAAGHEAPAPRQTPLVPENPDDGTDSGARYPTERDTRRIAEAQAEAVVVAVLEKTRKAEDAERQITDKLEKVKGEKRFIWGTVGVVLSTIAITVSTLAFGQSKLDGGVESGVAPERKRIDKLEARQDTFAAQQQQQAVEQVRVVTMLENVSRRLGTEVPPPAPKILLPDGGSP